VVADRQGGRALGIKLLAFRERRSHVEAIARSTHAGAERKFKLFDEVDLGQRLGRVVDFGCEQFGTAFISRRVYHF
jgi:hypothetical protein